MTKNKHDFTPTEALELLEGISKNTLYNDMNNGKLSYEERDWGNKKRRYIQGAELARVYGKSFTPQRLNKTYQKQDSTLPNESKIPVETQLLNQKLEFMNTQIEILQRQITEANEREKKAEQRETSLQTRIDKLTDALSKQTLLLEDMRQKSDKPKKAEPRKKFLGIF